MKSVLHRETIRLLLLMGLCVTALTLVFYIDNLLMSFVLAFVVYYILSPIISLCERKGLNRGLSIFFIYSLNTVIVASLFAVITPLIIDQLALLESELPQLQAGVLKIVSQVEAKIQSLFHLEEPLFRENLRSWMITQTTEITSLVPEWISDSLTTLFLTPFLAFFMLRDGATIKRQFFDLIPNRYFEVSLKLMHDMNDQVGSFIRARIAEALIVGFVTWIGLLIIGFPYAPLLALFAAFTNLIPYLGPIIGAVPAYVILMVTPNILFESMGMNILAVSIVYLTAHILDAVVIIPVVVAKIVDLHPVTVILVIILGAQLLGVLGMIISIPVASLIKLLITTFYQQTIRAR